MDTSGLLHFSEQQKWLRRNRRDLTISAGPAFFPDEPEKDITGLADSFYQALYSGDVLEIKRHEAFFRAIKEDCLLVCRLRGAANIATFGNMRKRRVAIEGELWETDGAEVVWRVTVMAVTGSERDRDESVVNRALQEIYRAIPEVPLVRQNTPDW